MTLAVERFSARLLTPVAALGIHTDATHVLGLSFLPREAGALAPPPNSLAYLVCVQLNAYFENSRYHFDLPLKLSGSHHQLRVWDALRAIPAGLTCTYGTLADQVGSNARAVGTACGKNPLPIIVPCHRVVARDGLGGFMGGAEAAPLAIKRWLLAHEAALR